jgi:RHS repeat-associated protein
VADDLDYMHARFCSPLTGRFLSVDRSKGSPDPARPQSWNRYSYSLNNPLKYVDPDGQVWISTATDPEEQARQVQLNRMLLEMGLPGPSAMAVGPRVAGLLGTRLGGLLSRLPGIGGFFSRVLGTAGGTALAPASGAGADIARRVLSDPNRMKHIFENTSHGLDKLVNVLGSEAKVVSAVADRVASIPNVATNAQGVFSVFVSVGGQLVQVTGRVINRAIHMSNFWVPPPL